MGYYAGLNPLRNVLADLYPAGSMAKVVATEAGLPEHLINFEGAAVEIWKHILTVAHNCNEVQDLIDVARSHFPKNERLVEAERVFHETPVPDLPEEEDERKPIPDGNGGQGDGNVNISVGGNSSGTIAGRDVNNAKVLTLGNVTGDGNLIGIDSQMTIHRVSPQDTPSLARFAESIQELQRVLAAIGTQTDLLSQVDPMARYSVPGVADELQGVAEELQAGTTENPQSIRERLQNATTAIETVLDKAKSLADKATDAGQAAAKLVAQLAPVVANLGTLVSWASKLWPTV